MAETLLHDVEYVDGKPTSPDFNSEFPSAIKLDECPDEERMRREVHDNDLLSETEKEVRRKNIQNQYSDPLDEYRNEPDENPHEQAQRIKKEQQGRIPAIAYRRAKSSGDTRKHGDSIDRSWYDYDRQ